MSQIQSRRLCENLRHISLGLSHPIESEALFKYPIVAVHFSSRTPMPPLDACVERLWLLSDAPAHSKERIAPSGTIDLVINLHARTNFGFTMPRNRSDANAFQELSF